MIAYRLSLDSITCAEVVDPVEGTLEQSQRAQGLISYLFSSYLRIAYITNTGDQVYCTILLLQLGSPPPLHNCALQTFAPFDKHQVTIG